MNAIIKNIYEKFLSAHQAISTDTRKISEGCLFFALRGENFNGNLFAKKALETGAAFAIVDDKKMEPDDRFIFVDDALVALQQLANHHRKQLPAKFIALTGSNGKTTTKELISSVLKQKFNTIATQGNLNNHIGVPLTLLTVNTSHQFAVIEMGANHQKEIEMLCKITEPDFGLITNVGKAHLEGFGGFDGVKKGKGEMYNFLRQKNAFVFINADNNHLNEMLGKYTNRITYGTSEDVDCSGKIIDKNHIEVSSISPFLSVKWNCKRDKADQTVQSNLTGAYNFENILSAICIGNYFGVTPELIRKGIESYFPNNHRSQVVVKDSNTFILDFYNANPTSVEAALLNFDKNYSGNKILLLGDMLELGGESDNEHLYIIKLSQKLNFSEAVFVGKNFGKHAGISEARFFETSEKASEWLIKQNYKDSFFLIKGSRGSKMELTAAAFGI